MARRLLLVALAMLALSGAARADDRVVATASDTATGELGGPVGPAGEQYPDKVVADPAASVVHVFLGTATGFEPDRPVEFAGPAITSDAVALDDLDRDGRTDLIVVNRALRAVWVLDGQGDGRFGEGRVVSSVVDPLQVTVGDFGGDRIYDDIAVSDPRSGQVVVVVEHSDRQRDVFGAIGGLAAGGGMLSWSQLTAQGAYQLVLSANGVTSAVRTVTSKGPIVPRFGRRGGRTVLAYTTCRGGCTPQLLNLSSRVETPLPAGVPRGCQVASVAVWDTATAYEAAAQPQRRCPARARGVWLRIGRERAARRGSGRLGDLHDGFLTWIQPGPRGEQLRIARVRGRAHTVARLPATTHETFVAPRINGRRLVFGIATAGHSPGDIELRSVALGARRACVERFSDAPRPTIPFWTQPAAIAIDGSRVYYADAPPPGALSRGIFQILARGAWSPTSSCVATT